MKATHGQKVRRFVSTQLCGPRRILHLSLQSQLPWRLYSTASLANQRSDYQAVEVIRKPRLEHYLPYSLLITCEHASENLPPGWKWPEQDARLKGTHWAIDLGAADLTRELAKKTRSSAVLATFSRLYVDANRPSDSPTLFRKEADGLPIELNKEINNEEHHQRLKLAYYPYHSTVATVVREDVPRLVLSLHSFTPNYEGQKRTMEVGVLYHDEQILAERFNKLLRDAGYDSRLNEPWSGLEGFMHSAHHHSKRTFLWYYSYNPRTDSKFPPATMRAIMLEMRQDLLTDPTWRAKFLVVLENILKDTEVAKLALTQVRTDLKAKHQ